jgi:hypothetical protein
MSFWVHLVDLESGEDCKVSTHMEGGTYVAGGTEQAELNVTCNYSMFYYKHLDAEHGLRGLNGKLAKDCIEALKSAVAFLGTEKE